MKKKERFSEVVNFKEMTVKEFFYAEAGFFRSSAWIVLLFRKEINVLTNNKPLPKTKELAVVITVSIWSLTTSRWENLTIISTILFKRPIYSIKISPVISTLGTRCQCQKQSSRKRSHPLFCQREVWDISCRISVAVKRCCLIVITPNVKEFYWNHP